MPASIPTTSFPNATLSRLRYMTAHLSRTSLSISSQAHSAYSATEVQIRSWLIRHQELVEVILVLRWPLDDQREERKNIVGMEKADLSATAVDGCVTKGNGMEMAILLRVGSTRREIESSSRTRAHEKGFTSTLPSRALSRHAVNWHRCQKFVPHARQVLSAKSKRRYGTRNCACSLCMEI